MMDKAHCVMNMEDEEEYLDFYDFSKAYGNHPLFVDTAQEESKKANSDEWSECDLEDGEESFSIVDEKSSQSFSIVDKPETTNSFSIVDKPETTTDEEFAITSVSSISAAPRGEGQTREQVFHSLDIKKAKLLPSGEVLLGNGKLMGHRQFHYIYKQKPRLPDQREAIVINKVALEYRKLRAL